MTDGVLGSVTRRLRTERVVTATERRVVDQTFETSEIQLKTKVMKKSDEERMQNFLCVSNQTTRFISFYTVVHSG